MKGVVGGGASQRGRRPFKTPRRNVAIALGAAAILALPLSTLPAAAADVFAIAVDRIKDAYGLRTRPGRDIGCRRAGECRAHLGAVTLRSIGNAAGTTLNVRNRAAPGLPTLDDACASALAALTGLDDAASRHVIAAASRGAVRVDQIEVSRSNTAGGLACRLHIPARSTTLTQGPRRPP